MPCAPMRVSILVRRGLNWIACFKQLAELGFSKISGTGFVFRHVALRTDFTDAHPQGTDDSPEFESCDEDEEWVLSRWKKVDDATAEPDVDSEA